MIAQKGANKTTREIDSKHSTQNSLSPLEHFTEHLVGVFKKSPWEIKLNKETSSLLIR
jgi:hypothetical protein